MKCKLFWLDQIEKAISHFEYKVQRQGSVANKMDIERLNNLNKQYDELKKNTKKQSFKGFKIYEPLKEINSEKCKRIAKSIRRLK